MRRAFSDTEHLSNIEPALVVTGSLQRFEEAVGGGGEFDAAFFEEIDLAEEALAGEGSMHHARPGEIAGGEFRGEGDAHAGRDEGEGGGDLVALQSRIRLADAAEFQGAIREAVAAAEVDEFLGVDIGHDRGLLAHGERVG